MPNGTKSNHEMNQGFTEFKFATGAITIHIAAMKMAKRVEALIIQACCEMAEEAKKMKAEQVETKNQCAGTTEQEAVASHKQLIAWDNKKLAAK